MLLGETPFLSAPVPTELKMQRMKRNHGGPNKNPEFSFRNDSILPLQRFNASRLVSRVGVGLEEDLDVRNTIAVARAVRPQRAVDEALETLGPVGVQRTSRDDEEPARVPNRSPDEPAVGNRLGGIEAPAVVEGAEASEAPDGGKVLEQRVVDRNPVGRPGRTPRTRRAAS